MEGVQLDVAFMSPGVTPDPLPAFPHPTLLQRGGGRPVLCGDCWQKAGTATGTAKAVSAQGGCQPWGSFSQKSEI